MYKWEQTLSYVRTLRSIHLFSPLLEGGIKLSLQLRHKILFREFLLYHQCSNALFNLRFLLDLLLFVLIRGWMQDEKVIRVVLNQSLKHKRLISRLRCSIVLAWILIHQNLLVTILCVWRFGDLNCPERHFTHNNFTDANVPLWH